MQAEQLEAALAISLSDYAAEGGGDTAGAWPVDGPADGAALAVRLPALPHDLWALILGWLRRSELGQA